MILGVVGIGLIGGSFVKAYHAKGHTVYAFDTDKSTMAFAKLAGEVDGDLDKNTIADCDLVLICITPRAAIAYLDEMGPYIGPHPVVIDCCGTKKLVCEACFPISRRDGFTYLGGHPMAGTQYSGYKYAKETLYHNQPMVIVPPDFDDIKLLGRVKELLSPAGFGRISVTDAVSHDEMIAFTSQMAHVVSNVYIKSRTAEKHKGFSAGSYKDMTRVAWLNAPMWAELFIENKGPLLHELDNFTENLLKTRDAIEAEDYDGLVALLEEGKRRKEEIDGR